MRFRHETAYQAPIHEVFAMLGDPDFRSRVCEHQGDLRHRVAVTGDEPGMTVEVHRVQSAAGLPAVATKFVGDEIAIDYREVWSGPGAADIEVTIPDKPGRVRGNIVMRESGGVTTQTFDADIKVSIPFLGGKLEEMIGGVLTASLRAEHEMGTAWLAGE